jgi:UDP-N-acetylglucosamine:LPS N-acetylglucosamine transferase
MKAKKVLAIASGGGHWVQMRRLRPAFSEVEVVFVSVKASYSAEVVGHRFYTVRDVTRWDKWGFAILVLQLLRILWLERPDVVVTTGSAPGFIALRMAKQLLGAKTMWMDSIANCETVSSSGQRARRFADVWLTQWEHLARDDGPEFWGSVL